MFNHNSGALQRLKNRLFEIKEALLGYPKLKKMFAHQNGYPLDLQNPQTHNARINWKKVFDRDPLLTLTSDKVSVREYVKNCLGMMEAEKILIPIYHISKTGKDIPHQNWDFEFFMKANHYSGGNMLVKPGTDPNLIESTCKMWLATSYGQAMHEWAYRDIPRRIICEKVLRTQNGQIPADVKYYCFHGIPKMLMILADRFEDQKRVFVDENLNLLEGAQMIDKPLLWPLPPLPNHLRMMEIAAKLSRPFTYCRVDFYSIGEEVYFGELTHYTSSGFEPFSDYDLDLAFGELWKKENSHRSVLEILASIKSKNSRIVN
jgi:hypothetical protein